MKDFTTYPFLYFFGKYAYSIKSKICFVDEVDPKLLSEAFNETMSKHDYATKSVVRKGSEYVFVDNNLPFVVVPYGKKKLFFNVKEVNYHLAFVEYEGKDIYFNISHCIATGYSLRFLVFDFIINYVNKKYNQHFPTADPIFYKYESIQPDPEDFKIDYEFPKLKKQKAVLPIGDYISSFFKKDKSILYEFDGNQLMKIIKMADGTPASLFSVLSYKTYIKVHPHTRKAVCSYIFHNPLIGTKYEQYHGHLSQGIMVYYDKKCKDFSLEKLNLITRGSILLQSEPCYAKQSIAEIFKLCEDIDHTKGLFFKQFKYSFLHPIEGIFNVNFTNFISYSGRLILPGIEKFVTGTFALQDSQFIYELTSLNDKIFFTFNLVSHAKKYEKAFEETLKEYGIDFKKVGYQEKNLVKTKINKVK